jgi:predicted nuclease of restriction endonuclease-like (RecB) superfamily
LTLAHDAREQELERGLLDHIQRFLLDLGQGLLFWAHSIICRSATGQRMKTTSI